MKKENGDYIYSPSDLVNFVQSPFAVLGPDSGTSSLESYLRWDNVSAFEIVELLYKIEIA